MLLCNSCEFKISSNMKWAISKNNCPSCGERIMNDNYLFELKKIRKDIEVLESVSSLNKSVSSSLDHQNLFDTMINDISILFLFSVKTVVKNNLIQENKFNKRFPSADAEQENMEAQDEVESFEQRVRRQVEEELGLSSDLNEESEDSDHDDDDDESSRIERLKQIHKKAQNTILKRTNKPITRIS